MAKSLIRNTLGNRTFGFAVPADGATAKTFAENNLDGKFVVYEVESTSGNDVVTDLWDVTVTGKSATTKGKHTFQFYANFSKTEDEIRTALLNKTFNGVKFEEVFVINMQPVTIA